MSIVATSDFTAGITRIAKPNGNTTLEDVITLTTENTLRFLMGDKLYGLYVADLDANGNPQTQKYKDLVNGVTYTDCNGYEVIYIGLKQMLKYFVFSEWKTENTFRDAATGTVQQDSDVSNKATLLSITIESNRFFDKGLRLYNMAIKFIYNHRDDYFTDISNWTYTRLEQRSKLKTITV